MPDFTSGICLYSLTPRACKSVYCTLLIYPGNMNTIILNSGNKNYITTRLTYNRAHLRSTKESLTDSVKNLFVRKHFCVKFFLGEIFVGDIFLGENFWMKIFWVKIGTWRTGLCTPVLSVL